MTTLLSVKGVLLGLYSGYPLFLVYLFSCAPTYGREDRVDSPAKRVRNERRVICFEQVGSRVETTFRTGHYRGTLR